MDPVRLSADAGFYKALAVSALEGTVPSKIAFQDVPDSGFCQGAFNGTTPGGGRKFFLVCNADGGSYVLSLSANAPGTTITVQSILGDTGQPFCGSLFFGCSSDDDCCLGFSCQYIDAGPDFGKLHRCDYSWSP